MFSSVIRVFVLYVFVLCALRLMGKRQIGEMQPFELVITLIIADLATIPMAQHTLPLLNGIVPVAMLLIIQFIFSFIAKKSLLFRKAISGRSVIIVNPDGVVFNELKKLNMTFNDLVEAIRESGYTGLDEVNYVIVETNGKISVIAKAANSPVTSEDLGIKKEETTLPITVVADGHLLKENMKFLGIDSHKVLKFVEKFCGAGCRIKDVCIFTLDPNGKVFLQKFGGKAISGNVNFKGNEL